MNTAPVNRAWMRPPYGEGEPIEVEDTPERLVPLMVAGWSQCDPPAAQAKETNDVHD